MEKAKSKQIALKKSYSNAYEKQVSKAGKMLTNKKNISKKIRKARDIFERLHNIPKFDVLSKNICSLCDLLSDYIDGVYQKAPMSTIVAVLGGVLYLVLPFDILADFIPVCGWLDDAAILAFVIATVQNDVREYLEWKEQWAIADTDKLGEAYCCGRFQ